MKKLILIFACLFVISSQNTNAQDIYGRARSIDTNYLNPNDFNVGEVIKIDTVGGQKVFVGGDVTDGLQTIIYSVVNDGSGLLTATELYNNTGAVLASNTISANSGIGDYYFTFTTDILMNKQVVIWSQPLTDYLSLDPGDNLPIAGYMFCLGKATDNAILLRTVNTSGVDASDIISQYTPIHIQFTLIDN